MSDLNPLQWAALIVGVMIVWCMLSVVCLMVLHGASKLREEAQLLGGVRRGNVPDSWPELSSPPDSVEDPLPSKNEARA